MTAAPAFGTRAEQQVSFQLSPQYSRGSAKCDFVEFLEYACTLTTSSYHTQPEMGLEKKKIIDQLM